MNVTEFTSLINKPATVNIFHGDTLEKITQEFPYFQSARALYLKSLYNQNSFKYNVALKITAAHTTDRSVLFDFITTENFISVQEGFFDKKTAELLDITVKETEIIEGPGPKLEQKTNTLEESIITSIKNANSAIEAEIRPLAETKNKSTDVALIEKLELGNPLSFSKNEKHSFQEWLQLTNFQPINREEKTQEQEFTAEIDSEKQKKIELIDKFIETSPKIPAIKQEANLPSVFFEPTRTDNSHLMTETLAKVYLEQKKYQKAIQAYEILILKYPEKSSFFADRILDIKNLQQNNK